MHKYPQNQSYVGTSGQTLTINVSMTLCNWHIHHQTHVLCGCTTFGTKSNYSYCSLDKGVARTKGWGTRFGSKEIPHQARKLDTVHTLRTHCV